MEGFAVSQHVNVAIVGAGPYGLSLAAHLKAAGVDYRIFGTVMESWRNNMPPGMLLKSYGDSSSLFDPEGSFPIETFCRERNIPFHPTNQPVSLADFIAYAEAFRLRFALPVEDKRVVHLDLVDGKHQLTLDDGETFAADRTVLAIGATPFRVVPPQLDRLPRELVSHSSAYGPLDSLDNRDVAIVGCGSSALDIGALAAEREARVTIVARRKEAQFQIDPSKAPKPPLWRHIVAPPALGLGAGYMLWLCAEAPQYFHRLPDSVRARVLASHLGPQGGYFIRDKVEKRVSLKLGRRIEKVEERHGRVHLCLLNDANGRKELVTSDHLVAATGYRVDVGRLDFLASRVREYIETTQGAPVLSVDYESSVPELYFVGLASARAFGPSMRFAVGARHPAAALAHRFSRRRARHLWSFFERAGAPERRQPAPGE
jgi:thioredoxin reductase